MPTRTVETTARQFKALVDPVLPLAEQSGTFPLLSAVKLNVLGGKLVAYATDRYRMGLQVSDIEAKTFDALLPITAIRQVLRIYRASKTYDAPLTLSTRKGEDGKTTIKITGLTGDKYIPNVTMQIEQPDGEYPAILTLLRDALKDKPAASQSYNMGHLTGFAPAAGVNGGSYATFVLPDDAVKPVQVYSGTGFMGILMPVRTPRTADGLPSMVPDWAKTLQAVTGNPN